jgi:TRAP-type transport system periplasmic protein
VSGELSDNHVRAMVVNVLPAYQIMSANEPIDSLDEFGGRTVRVAGSAMTFTVSALGASPVDMPAGDLYMSMQRGTVDSTILALASVKTYSLHALIKAMSTNGSFGSSGQFFAISDAAWERLTAEQ